MILDSDFDSQPIADGPHSSNELAQQRTDLAQQRMDPAVERTDSPKHMESKTTATLGEGAIAASM